MPRAIIEAAAWKDTLQPENKTGYVVQTDPYQPAFLGQDP